MRKQGEGTPCLARGPPGALLRHAHRGFYPSPCATASPAPRFRGRGQAGFRHTGTEEGARGFAHGAPQEVFILADGAQFVNAPHEWALSSFGRACERAGHPATAKRRGRRSERHCAIPPILAATEPLAARKCRARAGACDRRTLGVVGSGRVGTLASWHPPNEDTTHEWTTVPLPEA